jgi:SAM-dependent methyltransferase
VSVKRRETQKTWQQDYLDRFYSAPRGWIDGTTEFHSMCTAHIPSGSNILEIGAGRSNPTSRYLSSLGRLYGVDIDPVVRSNDALLEAHVLATNAYPFADACLDACVSNYVLEHIQDPTAHLSEIGRVLRPGGVYVFRTPNLYHGITLFSRLTPHWVHEAIANRLQNLAEDAVDPYPTYYRLNSRGAIRRAAVQARLFIRELRMVEKEPRYGMASKALCLGLILYERVVNSSALFAALRVNIFGVLERPLPQDRSAAK